jgi:hypothetical protein
MSDLPSKLEPGYMVKVREFGAIELKERVHRDLYAENFLPWCCPPIPKDDFLHSSLFDEIYSLIGQSSTWPALWHADSMRIILQGVSLTTGHVCALSIQYDGMSGHTLVEIRDEKLLEQLRSVNGQFTFNGKDKVFYYENLMSTADYRVYADAWRLPTRGQ